MSSQAGGTQGQRTRFDLRDAGIKSLLLATRIRLSWAAELARHQDSSESESEFSDSSSSESSDSNSSSSFNGEQVASFADAHRLILQQAFPLLDLYLNTSAVPFPRLNFMSWNDDLVMRTFRFRKVSLRVC